MSVLLVVVGSIQHETNSFCPNPATLADFDISLDGDMLGRIACASYLEQEGASLHPTVYANSVPSGCVSEEAFGQLLSLLLDRFPAGETVDGVWLYLHGAMEVENMGSGELAILKAVREKVGPSVPVAVAQDFHANNCPELADYANILCGYNTVPHSDMAETQVRAARHLVWSIKNHTLPRPVVVQVPFIDTGDKVITATQPMRSIIEETLRVGREEGILSASVFHGQPWVDAPNTGSSAIVVAREEKDLCVARRHARRLAQMLWDARKQYTFQVEALEPRDAVQRAILQPEGPVFISDSGDNTTAGALGNSAALLKCLLEAEVPHTLVAGITDPTVVSACRDLAGGTRVELTIGGSLDSQAENVRVKATYLHETSILGWDGEDGGKAVVFSCGGVDVIVTARPCAFISPEILESAGIRFTDYKIIAVKLGYLFPKLNAMAKKAYLALTPGASCQAVERLPFKRLRHPVYPMDGDFEWTAP